MAGTNKESHSAVLPRVRTHRSSQIAPTIARRRNRTRDCTHRADLWHRRTKRERNRPECDRCGTRDRTHLTAALEPTRQQIINASGGTDNLLTPTQIGKQLGISAIAVNKLLTEKGFQVKNENRSSSKEADYLATELGKSYSPGSPIGTRKLHLQQLRWFESIVNELDTP